MATLITLTLANGTLHTCDESCYNSTDPECTCICNGRNHGQGISEAGRITIVNAIHFISLFYTHFPDFQEVHFHFQNTINPKILAEHQKEDQVLAEIAHPQAYLHLDDRHLALTNPDHDFLRRTREHPTEAAQTDRDEPDR